jgi:hypothetical protein
MGFTKGHSGNPSGKPKGHVNKATREVRELARNLFDAAYWKLKSQQLHAGKCHPVIERTLLAYAYGEPKKTLKLEGDIGVKDKRSVLQQLPDDLVAQLAARAADDDDTPETVN